MDKRLLTRRQWMQGTLASLAGVGMAGVLGCSPSQPTANSRPSHRVVVIGGGFAGASCARALVSAGVSVVLIEPKTHYVACPLSNWVIGGFREIRQQTFALSSLANLGIEVVTQMAKTVDVETQRVTLQDGSQVPYDRLVLAPGIEMHWEALPGYSPDAAQRMPHAWQAGAQTQLLRDQLVAMPNGGTVVMSIPENPYRCPPGPYERASLIAHYLKHHKPRSKLVLLDAKDRFSKQSLFQQAWQQHYGDRLEWQGLSDGAKVMRVDAQRKTLMTDFDTVSASVANVIPPQRAGKVAQIAGATDASGWCPIHANTFESTVLPNVHVIGDAAIANAMPKSAFSANAQATLCAAQIVQLLKEQPVLDIPLLNTCYSLVTPDEGISVADVYQAEGERWHTVSGAGGTSPLDASPLHRRQEADYALDWFTTLTTNVYGA